jgi:hypothetical protein
MGVGALVGPIDAEGDPLRAGSIFDNYRTAAVGQHPSEELSVERNSALVVGDALEAPGGKRS